MNGPGYEIRSKLVEYGHHLCPENYQSGNILSPESFRASQMTEPAVEAAVRSYQNWFSPALDMLTMREVSDGGHKRMSIADGHAGANTQELLTFARCGCADYFAPEQIVEQGNWPESCRMDITTSYQMTLAGLSADDVSRLWQEADQNWQDVFNIEFQFVPDKYPNTRIHTSRAELPGSVLADQYLANSDCNSRSQGRVDNRHWGDVIFVTTITHEHGHALGLPHSQDPEATMYPSITQTSMSRRGRPNSSDIKMMIERGYTIRDDEPPEPETLFTGDFTIENQLQQTVGRFSIAEPVELDSPISKELSIMGIGILSDGSAEKRFIIVPKTRLL